MVGDREDLAPAFARDQPGECGEPDPVGGLVADPGDLPAQHRVLMPERENFRIFGHTAAQYGSGHGDQIPDERGDDRQRHPQIAAGQSRPCRQDQQTCRATAAKSFERDTLI
ncbi:hypothetical protein GCM10018966_096060 [Streptomyces yanii]